MKALKYLVVTVLAIVVIAILTLVGVALFVNPNHFKTQIETQVAKATGRTLVINGNIRWSFFPWLGLGVQDVSLSNAPGFGQAPFASLGEADVSVKLLPLLKGSFDIGTVKLSNLQMNLVKLANGKTNWDDLLKHSNQNTVVLPNANQSSALATTNTAVNSSEVKSEKSTLVINHIIISNAVVSWENAQKNIQKTVTIDNFDVSDLNTQGNPFNVFLALRVTGPANQQPYELNLTANPKLNMDTQKINISHFTLGLNNLQLNGNIQVASFKDNPTYKLTFNLPKTDVNKWLDSIGMPVTFKDSSALRNVTMSGNIKGGANQLSLSGFQALLDGSLIKLNVNITNLKNWVGTFNLSVDSLNLDKYKVMPTAVPASGAAATTALSTTPSASTTVTTKTTTQPKPGFVLPDSLLTGHITVGSLISNQLTISQINTDVSVKDHKVTLSPLSANFYGGQLAATMAADFGSREPSYHINETLTGTSIAGLLKDMNSNNTASGTLNLNANISAAGQDANSILGSLSGTGGLAIQSGQIPALNIMQALATAASTILKQPFANTSNGTSFSNLSATFNINRGLLQSDNLVLNSTLFTIAGKGSVNLVSQQLAWDLNVNPAPSSIPQIQALSKAIGGTIPLQVGGTMSHPTVTPNIPAIALAVGKNKLGSSIQQIGEQLNQGGKELGKSLKSLFK